MMSSEGNRACWFRVLRIAVISIGGLAMMFGAVLWYLYVRASLIGFDPSDSGPGVTNKQLIEMMFVVWLIPWFGGLVFVLLGSADWLRHVPWVVLTMTGVMLVVSLATYLIGAGVL
ncbi:hypothetical protein QFW96_23300 [Saccharopolyspora sp. TS4A08]|uniref:Uncharacterized protein n=1 Tax=Saccharopolyspora ipomoeae TaxID=3042027 RepID=A0ABT6PU91_9PSEU|nr:hypothetical protein [Saccharopolyspora sp. TS4A08]MDI2031574.1 hypothetical protein [Saccharopolyspora sp. TS4A08]